MTELDSTKEALRKTIRALRERLIAELKAEADRTYQLSVKLPKAKLREAARMRRDRLEEWPEEQCRTDKRPRDDHLEGAVEEAAHTLLNRLVVLRILEHHNLFLKKHASAVKDIEAKERQRRERSKKKKSTEELPVEQGAAHDRGGWEFGLGGYFLVGQCKVTLHPVETPHVDGRGN